MKHTKKEFEQFKKECERIKNVMGLHNWRIYYYWDDEEDCLASVRRDLQGYVALVYFPKEKKKFGGADIKRTAFHEVCHVLLARFNENARSRHCTSDELTESEEEVVRTLEHVMYGKI